MTLVPHLGGGADIALPSENLLALWYAGNGSKDHASISGSDGNPVTAWADSGSNGYDLTQATEAAQPTYHRKLAALNNRGAVQFGGNDYLQRTIAAGITANLDEYTILSVGIGNAEKYWYSENRAASVTPQVLVNLDGAGAANCAHRDDAAVQQISNAGAVNHAGVKRMIVAHRIGAASFAIRVDGAQLGTSVLEPTTTTIDRVTLGALGRATPIQFLTGYLSLIAVYGANNVATIEPIAADFYGFALP